MGELAAVGGPAGVGWPARNQYSLRAIAGGYVRRLLPYLRQVLASAVRGGGGRSGFWDRPVAAAVAMDLVPELDIVDGDDAVAMEERGIRCGFMDSYRSRYSPFAWEGDGEGGLVVGDESAGQRGEDAGGLGAEK